MIEQTRVSVPMETIAALHDLMLACVDYWPDPRDVPLPIRAALGQAVKHWLDSIGEADDDEDD